MTVGNYVMCLICHYHGHAVLMNITTQGLMHSFANSMINVSLLALTVMTSIFVQEVGKCNALLGRGFSKGEQMIKQPLKGFGRDSETYFKFHL